MLIDKRLFEGLTKWNAVVGDARRIPSLVRTAVRNGLTGCPVQSIPISRATSSSISLSTTSKIF